MDRYCPICEDKLVTVSAMTHGCCRCQQLWLMLNGKLQDGGDWPVARRMDKGAIYALIAAVVLTATGLAGLTLLIRSLFSGL